MRDNEKKEAVREFRTRVNDHVIAYSEKVETAWHVIGHIIPQLFPHLGDDPLEAEAWSAVYAHCAMKHGMTAEEVRQMPVVDLTEMLINDVQREDSGNKVLEEEATTEETTVDSRMAKLLKENPGLYTETQQWFAEQLRCTRQAIGRCRTWKAIMYRREEDKRRRFG